jgi:hypothetical protein
VRQGCQFSPLLFNIVLEFLARAIRQKKEIKGTQIGKDSQSIPIYRQYDPIPQRSNNSNPKLLNTINSFSNVSGYQINLKNQ